jgi:murein DD-endopeptidase / murein LD-carboxypeptidase
MRLTLFLPLFLLLSTASLLPARATNLSPVKKPDTAKLLLSVDALLTYARQHLHIRYRPGGTSTRGFDCSGFTRHCFQHVGMKLPHSSAAQGTVGLTVDRDQAQPGDLIFFKGHSSRGKRIGHVGLITKIINGRIQFIHSAWQGGVRYDYAHTNYYQRRFISVRRLGKLVAMSQPQ